MAEDTLRPEQTDESTAHSAEGGSNAESNGSEPQKPKRKRRTKAQIDADNAASEAAGEAKPKRKRRTKAEIEADKAAADTAGEKPKRKRRTKAEIEADKAASDSSGSGVGKDSPERPARRTRPSRTEIVDLSSKGVGIVDLTSSGSSRASAPKDASEPAPKRRRTRRSVEAEPVASSDNLPSDIAEAPDDQRQSQDGGQKQDRSRNKGGQDQGDRRDYQRGDDDRQDNEGGGRRRNKRKRNKGGGQNQGGQNQGGQNQGGQNQGTQNQGTQNQGGQGQGGQNQGGGHPGEPFDGMLELIGDKKFGFIRGFTTNLNKGDNDPFMPPPLIQKYNLRDGVRLTGLIKPGRKGAWQVTEVHEVMGMDPDEWKETTDFDAGMVIYPEEKLRLVSDKDDLSMRVVDLVSPIGKGQRALIVAPPRAGKTMILKAMAAGLAKNHPDVKLVALLIDERPEEVTDFRRNTAATVFASSNDFGEDNHVRVATLAFEYSRRMVEQGNDVVILLDSLTRLGRTFNLFGGNSGRTMSGGLDARALLVPRKIFGSARNIEDGGSLTIVATALIETGSRMDDVIFEEFKGTGNSEIVLDRELAEQRIYPAINIRKSGTRNEDRLVAPEHLRQRHMLLRALNSRHPVEAMQALSKQISLSDSNASLLEMLVPE